MQQSTDQEEQHKLLHFLALTGAEVDEGTAILSSLNWDLEAAVEEYHSSSSPQNTHLSPSTSTTQTKQNNQGGGDGGVREPILPKKMVLADQIQPNPYPNPYPYRNHNPPKSVFEAFRDFKDESEYEIPQNAEHKEKLQTLARLFRPPLDLLFRGSFEAAQRQAVLLHKWIMVNVQRSDVFACSLLNRDTWSNEATKAIISENFIFWQVNAGSEIAGPYIDFYPISSFPHIAILDPRNAERLKVWEGKQDTQEFTAMIVEFCVGHKLEGDRGGGGGMKRKREKPDEVHTSQNHTAQTQDRQPEAKKRKLENPPPYAQEKPQEEGQEKKRKRRDEDERRGKRPRLLLPPETKERLDSADCILQLRMDDGSVVKVGFSAADTINDVYKFVQEKREVREKGMFNILSTFPRKIWKGTDDLSISLKQAGLVPRAVLHVTESRGT